MSATTPSDVENGTGLTSAAPSSQIKYALPVDREESQRLELTHHISYLSLEGKLHLAPLDRELHNVLDMGTGTGFWAIDFAKLHPKTNVIGSDTSTLERPKSFVKDDLPNLAFVIADAEEEWKFDVEFDYIHGRLLQICFVDVKSVFGRAFASLRPGGWLEMQDIFPTPTSDDGSGDGSALLGWYRRQELLGASRGRPFTEPPKYKQYMEEIGFVDVHVETKCWPLGDWNEDPRLKEIGQWQRIHQTKLMKAFSRAGPTPGRTKEDDEAEIDAVEREMRDPDIHIYVTLYVVWGRKPPS